VGESRADYGQIINNEKAQIQAAEAVVVDNENKVRSAASNVETMQANLNSANASLADAQSKLSRYQVLYKQGMIAAQDLDDQIAAANVARANVGVATANLNAAKSALVSAKAELDSAIKTKESVALQAQSNIAKSKATLDQAEASLKLAVANRGNIPSYVANLKARVVRAYDPATQLGLSDESGSSRVFRRHSCRAVDLVLRGRVGGADLSRANFARRPFGRSDQPSILDPLHRSEPGRRAPPRNVRPAKNDHLDRSRGGNGAP
jgi:hypothetical protein